MKPTTHRVPVCSSSVAASQNIFSSNPGHCPLQAELIGRVQKQESDLQYYTCVCYIKVVGTPVYGFLPKGISSPHSCSSGAVLMGAASQAADSPNTADSATTAVSSSLYHQLQSGLNLTSQSQEEPGKTQLAEPQQECFDSDLQPDWPQRGKYSYSTCQPDYNCMVSALVMLQNIPVPEYLSHALKLAAWSQLNSFCSEECCTDLPQCPLQWSCHCCCSAS